MVRKNFRDTIHPGYSRAGPHIIVNCCTKSFPVHVYLDLTITGASCTQSLFRSKGG